MIITSDFVLLNFPKTGSSFVRNVIKRAYKGSDSKWLKYTQKLGLFQPWYEELYLPKIDEARNLGIRDQHGTWRQIPNRHRGKPVVSVSRNPFERYLSAYHYGWWKKYPPADASELGRRFPGFPDISFPQYYEMIQTYACRDRLKGLSPKIPLGLHSIQFIQFYFRDPEAVLEKIDRQYIDDRAFEGDMADIHFLQQETLADDLKQFLISLGRDEHSLSWLENMERVNVTERGRDSKGELEIMANNEIVSSILSNDHLLFTLFPGYLPQSEAVDDVSLPGSEGECRA